MSIRAAISKINHQIQNLRTDRRKLKEKFDALERDRIERKRSGHLSEARDLLRLISEDRTIISIARERKVSVSSIAYKIRDAPRKIYNESIRQGQPIENFRWCERGESLSDWVKDNRDKLLIEK
jgi:hypothetical protein